MKRLPIVFEAALAPVAILYRLAMRARNFAFDGGWKTVIDPGVPVISVGNLTAGGTGKTPVTALLTENLTARGRKVGIVSRGYGGTENGPARVPTDGDAETARRYGDEPTWLASRFEKVPVVIGADRVAAVRSLVAQSGVDLVIADDAFQHRRLARRFDIVVLDALEPEWHYRALPVGRMREGFEALNRASAVLITKANLASRERVESLKSNIEDVLRAREVRPPVVELESRLKGLSKLGATALIDSDVLRARKVALASGIGRPESFSRLVSEEAGATIVHHEIFPDHHRFTSDDFALILARASAAGAEALVVTEKDSVKMSDWRPEIPTWVTRLEAIGSLEGVYAALDRRLV